MHCTACGGANLDDARFCCHCGVRIAGQPPAGPAPSPARAAPRAPFKRLVTMGGPEVYEFDLPMRGPKPRTLALAGIGIGAAGVAIGAAVAWRAAHGAARSPAASDRHLALLAVPHVIVADAGAPPSAVNTVAPPPDAPPREAPAARAHAPAATPPRASASARSVRPTTPVAAPDAAQAASTAPTSDDSTTAAAATTTTTSTTERTDATGTLDSSVIQSVYLQNRSQVEGCGLLLAGNSSNVGTVRVRVRVGTSGGVASTRVLDNTTSNTFLGDCVQNTIRAWRFPAPQGGEVEFDYQFGFGT